MAPDEQSDTAAEAEAEAEAPDEDAPGVFGNLPKTRPGARSPRREETAARRASATAKATRKPKAKRAIPPPPPPRTPPAAQEPEAQTPQAEGGGGIEDVAWAGVAAAAEAATIGVRLANRALEAMRDAVDRR